MDMTNWISPLLIWWWWFEIEYIHFSSVESSFFSAAILRRPPEDALPSWGSVWIFTIFLRRFWNCIMLIYEEPPLSQVVKLNKTKENTLCESWKKHKPRWHDHFVPPVEGGEEEGRAQEEEGIQAWRRKTFWLSYPHVSPLILHHLWKYWKLLNIIKTSRDYGLVARTLCYICFISLEIGISWRAKPLRGLGFPADGESQRLGLSCKEIAECFEVWSFNIHSTVKRVLISVDSLSTWVTYDMRGWRFPDMERECF